jgi:DNA repair protein RadC
MPHAMRPATFSSLVSRRTSKSVVTINSTANWTCVASGRSDKAMTRNLVEAAKALDVAVHDHILIASEGSLSFRRQGLL